MKSEILRVVDGFRRGKIPPSEFVAIIFQHIDETTLPIFSQVCPPELIKVLEVVVKASPTTDAEWAKVKFVQSAGGSGLTAEESEKAAAILLARYRKGVEIVRKHMVGD